MKTKLAVLVCLAALVAAGCSSSKKSSAKTSSDSSSTTSAAASNPYGGGSDSSSATSSTMAAASGAQVKVATVAKYGQVLVAADGKTLYLFEKDNGTTSACTSAQCTGIWPAYAGPASAGSGVTASKLSTATGQVANQVVYNGHLLYEFSGDKAAGDVNGTSIPEWYPVSPAGDKVDES